MVAPNGSAMAASQAQAEEAVTLVEGEQPVETLEIKQGACFVRRYLLDGTERIDWDCSMVSGDDIVLTSRISCPGLQHGAARSRGVTERERFTSFTGFVDLSKDHAGWLQELGFTPKESGSTPAARRPEAASPTATSSSSSSACRPVLELELDNEYSWFTPKVVQLRIKKATPAPPRPKTFAAALEAYEPASRWEHALQLLSRMREQAHVTPDVDMFNIALSACKEAKQWEATLQLIEDMWQAGVSPNATSFEHAISACEGAGQAEQALRLIDELDAVVTGGGGGRRVPSHLAYDGDDDLAFIAASLREAVSRCPAEAQGLLGQLLAAQESLEQYVQAATAKA